MSIEDPTKEELAYAKGVFDGRLQTYIKITKILVDASGAFQSEEFDKRVALLKSFFKSMEDISKKWRRDEKTDFDI